MIKILYTGGGTMGSVSPLLAVHQKLSSYEYGLSNKYECLWLGTKFGPERKIVEKKGIKFKPIASGKLRRYFDLCNFTDFVKIKLGFWQTLIIILKFKPDLILSAGSFVAVPVVWASWVLRKKIIIHQQDVKPGLANKLCLPFATRVTVALNESLKDFPKNKTVLVGNPIRETGNWKLETGKLKEFGLKKDLSILLVIGGGTGALAINKLIIESLPELTKYCQIIHLTGGRAPANYQLPIPSTRDYQLLYKQFNFITDKLFDAIQLSDIVISRAGMSTLTELAYFKKASIIIPIPNSHQEANAKYFADKSAGIYLEQKKLTSEKLVAEVKKLLADKNRREQLGQAMNKIFVDYSAERFVKVILEIIES